MSDFDIKNRDKEKPEDTAFRIKMKWDSPAFDGKYLLLVEDNDDRKCFFKFFDPKMVEFEVSRGCSRMLQILNFIQDYKIPNFAIQDSDFARACKCMPSKDNVFFTDFHDHEMMCLSEKDVMKALFLNNGICFDEVLVNEVFDDLKMLSYFKWYNYSNHLNVNFDGYNPSGKETSDLRSFNSIFNAVKPQSPHCVSSISEKNILDFVKDQKEQNPFEITNGHDFLGVLSQKMKKKYKDIVHNLSDAQIRMIIYSSFTMKYFIKTKLYKSIFTWAGDMGVSLFIA